MEIKTMSLSVALEAAPNAINHLQNDFAPKSITSKLSYLIDSGVRPISYAFPPPSGESWENCSYDLKDIEIFDIRQQKQKPTLDKEGFQVFKSSSYVKDFEEEDLIKSTYYPEVELIALSATGGRRAFVFDHLIRRTNTKTSAMSFGRDVDGLVPSANGRIHNDYSEESGLSRLSKVIPGAYSGTEIDRFSIVNLWRPLNGPILDTPLALCDSRTVDARDRIAAEVRYPHRTGEVYLFKHSINHRWSYLSAMRNDEILVFKQYDSLLSGVSRFTPHAAFDHPNSPPGVAPRQSIEIRCLVIH
jgi:hypothetical protein